VGADIVLVGLDGADRDLVACLADEGRLPVIARMRERGLWGDVESFVGLGDDAALIDVRPGWRLVATTDETLFGDTEFALRDSTHALVAQAYAAHLEKKVATPAPVATAPTAMD
jgi:hypothetical protein